MTLTGSDAYDADDALFDTVRRHFSEDEIVALTAIIAWENASSKFNRALRIPAQGLWKRGG
jgi:alkylhydroperoxidase family enzyme